MKRFLAVFASLVFVLIAFGRTALAEEKPNIVIFLSDDHGFRDSSVYGAKDIQTPNMERLAAAGMTFDRAYVASPSCAPSRAALLTGLMPARNGAEANHSKPDAGLKKLPAYLQELGYEVVSFGKVSHYRHTGDYGFDHFANDKFHEHIAIPEAMKWIQQRKSGKPLCLFVGSNWPHVPWPKDDRKYDTAGLKIPPDHVDTSMTREMRSRYYAAIARMDEELGLVYDLAHKQLGTNTLFLHTSDHGAQLPFGKWNLYESETRTPMIVAWPGKIVPGSRNDAMVSWIDILPTLVEAAGGTADKKLDGRSFLGVLSGGTKEHRELIFATHSGDGNHNVYPCRSVCDKRWKYILNLHPEFKYTSHITGAANEGVYWPTWLAKAESDPDAKIKVRHYQERPREELYDLENDPWEQNNLAKDPASKRTLKKLRSEVKKWMEEQGDKGTVFGEPKLRSPAKHSSATSK